MPTDPKWRTIARASGQAIGNVIAVYVHMLVCASNATERGRTQSFNSEDVANALDMETEQVEQIVAAMQGRVIDGDVLKGWAVRQVSREDGSAERSKAWREAKKQAKQAASNATERNRTHPERKQTPDKDKDKDKSNTPKPPLGVDVAFETFWSAYPKKVGKDAGRKAFDKRKVDEELLKTMLAAIAVQSKSKQWTDESGKYIPNPATWLNDGRWMDGGVAPRLVDDWFAVAGFDNEYEARNMGCSPSTAKFFRDGKKVLEAA